MNEAMFIGSDHRGYVLKEYIKNDFKEVLWLDLGCDSTVSVDYPCIAHAGAQLIQEGRYQAGILICGSGIGMSIVANRYQRVRAALVWNEKVALQSKEHDNANILVFPADYITHIQARNSLKTWNIGRFFGGKYQSRIDQIDI